MNFYEFYNLLNENTISQELKKLKPKIEEINKLLPIDLFDYLKKSIKEDFGVRLDDNSLNAISKWFLFIHLTWWRTHNNALLALKAVSIDGLSKYIFHELETHIIQLRNMSNDYLAANLDQGRLNPQLISKFNDPKFKYEDLEELVNQYHENLRKGLIKIPGKPGKNILSFNDGYKWVNLEQGYCNIEGKAMGHCGNVGQIPGDTILSLRDSKNIPHLTFILNNGYLGEMKGRGNDKPAEKYHSYIVELLKSPIIKRIRGGGYLPENNFQLSDLSEQQIKELIRLKPEFERDLILEKLLPRISTSYKWAKSEPLNEDELLKILDDNDREVRFMILKYINSIFSHPDINISMKNITKNVLLKLSTDKDAGIRSGLAEIRSVTIPREILSKLSKDKRFSVRRSVAINKDTPKEVLIELSNDEDITVREGVADNPNAPAEALENIVNNLNLGTIKSDENFLKYKVINNKNTSIETIEKLTNDENPDVRHQAVIKYTRSEYASPKVLMKIFIDLLQSASRSHVRLWKASSRGHLTGIRTRSLPTTFARTLTTGEQNVFKYLARNSNFPMKDLDETLDFIGVSNEFKKLIISEIEEINRIYNMK